MPLSLQSNCAKMNTKIDDNTSLSGGRKPSGLTGYLPTLLPLFLLAATMILPYFLFSKVHKGDIIGLGPAVWPHGMLWGIGLFSVLWIARDFWARSTPERKPTLSAPIEDVPYDFRKSAIGLVLIVIYGWLLPNTGFALTTSTFIAIWCYLGSMRNWKIVLPVSILGTIALLWLFMGLALMPLPRGMGIFEGFSIGLLKAIGIY